MTRLTSVKAFILLLLSLHVSVHLDVYAFGVAQGGIHGEVKCGELASSITPRTIDRSGGDIATRNSPTTTQRNDPFSDDDGELAYYKPPTPGNVYKNTGFVKAEGTRLTLNGLPYEFGGTNAFYAALDYIMSEAELKYMLREQARAGTSVIRVFSSFFDSVPPPSMMPEYGVFSESALRRLDLVLVEAAKRNIRVIIVLSNYWNFLGGMQKFVDVAYPSMGLPLETFYIDPYIREQWKGFVSVVLGRRNSITGVAYRDDPTIFSYELANEPRTSKGWDKARGRLPGATICDWVAEMSAFVRSQDGNHLLTIGDEGMRADVPARPGDSRAWINDGTEGVDWLCNLQYADVATVHLYPDAWAFSPAEYQWLGPNYLQDRRDLAWARGKPIILEEYGMRRGWMDSREAYFGWVQSLVSSLGFAGSLVWAAAHEPREGYDYGYHGYNDGQGYVFGLSGADTDGAASVVRFNRAVKSRIDAEVPCLDVPPDGQWGCKQQSEWGKCVERGGFMEAGVCDWSCGRCGT